MNLKAITIAAAVGSITLTAGPVQAFGFGNLIKSVGGAAGVAPITDVVGGAIHQTEVENTNRMLRDNARKAQLKQDKINAQNRATEEAIEAEVERRVAAERRELNRQREELKSKPGVVVSSNERVNKVFDSAGRVTQPGGLREFSNALDGMFGSQEELNRRCGYPNDSNAYNQCKRNFHDLNMLESLGM